MSLRTPTQNNSLHLYLTRVADEMNKHGITMQDVLKVIRRAEVRPTMTGLKEVVWKPMQVAMLGKESTTELEKSEVDQVFEMFNSFIGTNFHIHIPWPVDENKIGNYDVIL